MAVIVLNYACCVQGWQQAPLYTAPCITSAETALAVSRVIASIYAEHTYTIQTSMESPVLVSDREIEHTVPTLTPISASSLVFHCSAKQKHSETIVQEIATVLATALLCTAFVAGWSSFSVLHAPIAPSISMLESINTEKSDLGHV